MSLSQLSQFYYGHMIDVDNRYIDFNEGSGELTATLEIGSYTLTKFLDIIVSAMNEVGSHTYSASVNRTTGVITVTTDSGSDTFKFLGATGSNVGQSALTLMGFALSDTVTAAQALTGSSRSGSVYEPNFPLQSYLPSAINKKPIFSTVSKSASGQVSVQTFGEERFVEFNIRYITNLLMTRSKIQNSQTSLESAIAFMEYCITKSPIEFMEDKSHVSIFEKIALESTPESQDGTGYRLKERYDEGLPEIFDTGILKFRVITE